MIFISTLLWFTVAAAVVVDDQAYCSIRYRRLCQGKGRHVACQFPTPEPGEACENYTQIKFTNDVKYFITHYINRRRQRLAAGNERVRGGTRLPRPKIMMQVQWDRELARLAQRLADQCYFVHDNCRATVRYPYAGQTVGEVRWRRFSDSDELSAQRAIRRVLDAWWGEKRRVQARQLTTPFRITTKGTVWGHFSQLAVWTLRAVGCGAVRHGADYPRLLLVCDFSHTNMLGQRTLNPGPLAPCPPYTARNARSSYPLLCSQVRHIGRHKSDYSEVESNKDYYENDDLSDSEDSDTNYTGFETNDDEEHRNEYLVRDHIGQIKSKAGQIKPDRERVKNDRLLFDSSSRVYSKQEYMPSIIDFSPTERSIEIGRTKEDYGNRGGDRKKDIAETSTLRRNSEPIRLKPRLKIPEISRQGQVQFDEQYNPMILRDMGRRWSTTRGFIMMDKLDQELKKQVQSDRKHWILAHSDSWQTRRSNFRRKYGDREHQENQPGLVPRRQDLTTTVVRSQYVLGFRDFPPINRNGIASTEHRNEDVRQKWKQFRKRPLRPGVNALLSLNKLEPTPFGHTEKVSAASLMMDKDDEAQLFRDTGFKPDWRQLTKS